MADKTSMLIVVTPDGVSHGQRLTDHEAVELTRRLLELREGDEPEPSPRQNGGRRPGAGRKRITLTKAFVSAYGIDDRNVTTNHENQAALLMRVFEKASQKFLLADRSKFGRTGLHRLATRAAFDEIVSD